MIDSWNDEIEILLEKIRINSINLSEYHRSQYYNWKSYGKYFRIPVIILASINSTASVGLQKFVNQKWISLLSCGIGMIIGIVGSIELYLSIQSSMDLEFKQSKEFYSLAIDIYKILNLKRIDRSEDGKEYLNSKFSYYVKLVEASNLLHKKMKIDVLTYLPKKFENNISSTSLNTPSISSDNLTEKSIEYQTIHTELNNWTEDKIQPIGLFISENTTDNINENKV